MLFYVHNDELYETIEEMHIANGHEGINKMRVAIKSRYANITQYAITLYASMCEECERRRNRTAAKSVECQGQAPMGERSMARMAADFKPEVTPPTPPVMQQVQPPKFNLKSRGVVVLIDMQKQPDGDYKYILRYEASYPLYIIHIV